MVEKGHWGMLAMLERLKQAPLAPYPQRRGRVEGTRKKGVDLLYSTSGT